jgi:hypothetical protein
MGVRKLTTLQHKKIKQDRKRLLMNEEKQMCKRERKLLKKISITLSEDLIRYIYTFVNNDLKYDLSFYKQIFIKYIYNHTNTNNKILSSIIFNGYIQLYNYCTFYKISTLLKELLYKIPFELLEKYLYYGSPSKYFNIAFPDEPNIKEYIETNYKNTIERCQDTEFQRKNFVFEIVDILSYFATKTFEFYAKHSVNTKNKFLRKFNKNSLYGPDELIIKKETQTFCSECNYEDEENEIIFKKLMLSIFQLC